MKHLSQVRRSSAPLTETRAHLEMYQLSNERARLDTELRAIRAHAAAIEQKLANIKQREQKLNDYLDAQRAEREQQRRSGRDFVLEY